MFENLDLKRRPSANLQGDRPEAVLARTHRRSTSTVRESLRRPSQERPSLLSPANGEVDGNRVGGRPRRGDRASIKLARKLDKVGVVAALFRFRPNRMLAYSCARLPAARRRRQRAADRQSAHRFGMPVGSRMACRTSRIDVGARFAASVSIGIAGRGPQSAVPMAVRDGTLRQKTVRRYAPSRQPHGIPIRRLGYAAEEAAKRGSRVILATTRSSRHRAALVNKAHVCSRWLRDSSRGYRRHLLSGLRFTSRGARCLRRHDDGDVLERVKTTRTVRRTGPGALPGGLVRRVSAPPHVRLETVVIEIDESRARRRRTRACFQDAPMTGE